MTTPVQIANTAAIQVGSKVLKIYQGNPQDDRPRAAIKDNGPTNVLKPGEETTLHVHGSNVVLIEEGEALTEADFQQEQGEKTEASEK